MQGSGGTKTQSFAIVGAGISGLSCAKALTAQGHKVTLFDKGRGPGGRMSTRRFDTPLGETMADHGAQYFTARDPDFQSEVLDWERAGAAAHWPVISDDAWVGTPTMNAIIRHLSSGFDVRWNSRIDGLTKASQGWSLVGAAEDTAHYDFEMVRRAMLARFQPCWTVLYAFDTPLPGDTLFLRDYGAIGWASRELAKPGRTGMERWVVQANASWSTAHLNSPAETVADLLFTALEEGLGSPLPKPIAQSPHRWRYAMSAGLGAGSMWNPALGLGVCGDWLLGPRIESGWLSGQHLAQSIAADDRVAA